MDLPKEDILIKQKRERKKEYDNVYFKKPNVKKHRQKQKQQNILKLKNIESKPIYVQYQKEFYDKQSDGRKNPYLRSNEGKFTLTFN
tara:strand:+ start:827 stop:1087 length:261 start_codon:yes stop_codon:yes gene_type:complete